MMRIFPTEKFTITTHLRSDRVEAKLLNNVEGVQLDRNNVAFSSHRKNTMKVGFRMFLQKIKKLRGITKDIYYPLLKEKYFRKIREVL